MIVQVTDPIIEIHSLTACYDNKPVLWNVDFSIPKGVIAGVLGPNGSGKTTLLKSIMGLIAPTSGYVKLYDRPLDEVRSKVSYVPQRESVDWDFPVNVMDVVLMGRYQPGKLFKRLSKEDKGIAAEALDKVGMSAFAKRQISKLSGGQQQRVFLARALAQQAELYIMDEPFVGVDAATEEAILKLMGEMKAEGKTVVVVHHDLQTAQTYFDWITLLNTYLVASGPKETVFTNEIISKAFGGQLNVLAQLTQELKSSGIKPGGH